MKLTLLFLMSDGNNFSKIFDNISDAEDMCEKLLVDDTALYAVGFMQLAGKSQSLEVGYLSYKQQFTRALESLNRHLNEYPI